VVIVSCFAICGRFARMGNRGPMGAFLFYVVTLAPALGFIDFSYMAQSFVADRFQYLASIGPIALFSPGLNLLWTTFKWGDRSLNVVRGLMVAGGVLVTWKYSEGYGNPELLWLRNLAINPDSPEAHQQLGTYYIRVKRLEDATTHLSEAVRLRPSYSEPH